jgi:serine/threonine protein kinase
MPLANGTKLGPYEIVAPIGAGGMGEVYRARDTRLDRVVAIKVLPEHLADTPASRQRFEREAKSISSLNHPRICQLYDVGSQDCVSYLVMEYLEGETLANRLKKGALLLEQVLKIGMEIAEALDKAHRAGIVHRDLKPSNIMLTKSGAKLMDFGLAKAAGAGPDGPQAAALLLSAAETLTSPSPQFSPLTSAGAIVGTVQYMSPEQIEGKEADSRSDIFALGAVLFEMATGMRAFEGKSQLSVASAILEMDPQPVSAVHPTSPLALDLAIRTSLAKDPDARFQSAHDLALQLRWIAEASAASVRLAPRSSTRRRKSLLAVSVLLVVAAAVLAGYLLAPRDRIARPLHAFIEPPESLTIDSKGDFGGPAMLSPQGDKIVFCAHGRNNPKGLWVRSLESFSTLHLEGTDGAYDPFWSPDGKFVGFFANGKLNRIPAEGGPITVLTDAQNARGASWGPGDVILVAADLRGPISQVSANGGKATPTTTVDAGKHTTHRWPSFLPDGKHFIYLATNHNGGNSAVNGIYFASLDGRENRLIVASDAGGEYASGYLLFHSGTALMAQQFDPGSGKLTGEAEPVVSKIHHDSGVWRTLFTVSRNGLLVYEAGSSEAAGTQLVWFDRTGKRLGQVGDTGSYMDPRVSPDGKRLAVSYGDPQREIWIFGLDRETKTRLTFGQLASGTKVEPAWSPDGRTIAFVSAGSASGGNNTVIFRKASDGSGKEEKLSLDEAGTTPSTQPMVSRGYRFPTWSPDGQYLAYIQADGPGGAALYAKPVAGSGEPFVVVPSPSPQSNIGYFRISPNGRWVAYTSNETGRAEIYVSSFPRGEGKRQVSTNGADNAVWRLDGKELFYDTYSDEFTACTVTEKGKELEIGTPQVLFTANASAIGAKFDVSADGKRFLINLAADEASPPLRLVVNWTAELKRK